jgi:hypothetical protein
MANIREFQTPALSLRPSETGVEATAGAARRVGAFYNQRAGATDELARNTEQLGRETGELGNFKGGLLKDVGNRAGSAIATAGEEYVKYEDNKQISHGAAVASDMFVNLEKQWNDTLKGSDPNDPSVAAQFKEQTLQPALDKFSENFTTENSQKFAEGIVNKYRSHFDAKTAADMSTMAGIAAKQNATQTINSLSSAVYMDPTSLDTSIDVLKHSAGHIVDSSPTIDPETGARIKSELNQKGVESLVKSAVSGMIQKNPNIDLDAIQKKYPEYINGGELKMFQAAAQRQAKTDAAATRADTLVQKQQADLKVHADATKTLTDNVAIDPTSGRPMIKPGFFKQALEIARANPNAPSAAATARTMLDWGESQQNKETKVATDPLVKAALTDRMFDADHPTTTLDLMKAQTAGKLNDHDFNALKGMVDELEHTPLKGEIWKNTVTALKDRMIRTDLPEGRDAIGAANYAAFMGDFIPKYLAKSRTGTLEPNALNLRDPNSMISKAMQPYQLSMQDRLKATTAALVPSKNLTAGDSKVTGMETKDLPPITRDAPRTVGNTYMTPQGPLKWTGTGWVRP